MLKKACLSELNRQLRAVPEKPKATAGPKSDPNPARGERGDFLNVTVRLPAGMLADLATLGVDRRKHGIPNRTVSALIREAVAGLLDGESRSGRYCPKCQRGTVDETRGNISTGVERVVCSVCSQPK
jgi:hypothetical protein